MLFDGQPNGTVQLLYQTAAAIAARGGGRHNKRTVASDTHKAMKDSVYAQQIIEIFPTFALSFDLRVESGCVCHRLYTSTVEFQLC